MVVAPVARVRLPADDFFLRQNVEVPRDRCASGVDCEDAQGGGALPEIDLGVPPAHLLRDPLARVVVAIRRGRPAPGQGQRQVLRIVRDRGEEIRVRRGLEVPVRVVGERPRGCRLGVPRLGRRRPRGVLHDGVQPVRATPNPIGQIVNAAAVLAIALEPRHVPIPVVADPGQVVVRLGDPRAPAPPRIVRAHEPLERVVGERVLVALLHMG